MAQITERIVFRLVQTPCCEALLCWVNPRLPNYCPECGKFVFPTIKGCVLATDDEAFLKYDSKRIAVKRTVN